MSSENVKTVVLFKTINETDHRKWYGNATVAVDAAIAHVGNDYEEHNPIGRLPCYRSTDNKRESFVFPGAPEWFSLGEPLNEFGDV